MDEFNGNFNRSLPGINSPYFGSIPVTKTSAIPYGGLSHLLSNAQQGNWTPEICASQSLSMLSDPVNVSVTRLSHQPVIRDQISLQDSLTMLDTQQKQELLCMTQDSFVQSISEHPRRSTPVPLQSASSPFSPTHCFDSSHISSSLFHNMPGPVADTLPVLSTHLRTNSSQSFIPMHLQSEINSDCNSVQSSINDLGLRLSSQHSNSTRTVPSNFVMDSDSALFSPLPPQYKQVPASQSYRPVIDNNNVFSASFVQSSCTFGKNCDAGNDICVGLEQAEIFSSVTSNPNALPEAFHRAPGTPLSQTPPPKAYSILNLSNPFVRTVNISSNSTSSQDPSSSGTKSKKIKLCKNISDKSHRHVNSDAQRSSLSNSDQFPEKSHFGPDRNSICETVENFSNTLVSYFSPDKLRSTKQRHANDLKTISNSNEKQKPVKPLKYSDVLAKVNSKNPPTSLLDASQVPNKQIKNVNTIRQTQLSGTNNHRKNCSPRPSKKLSLLKSSSLAFNPRVGLDDFRTDIYETVVSSLSGETEKKSSTLQEDENENAEYVNVTATLSSEQKKYKEDLSPISLLSNNKVPSQKPSFNKSNVNKNVNVSPTESEEADEVEFVAPEETKKEQLALSKEELISEYEVTQNESNDSGHSSAIEDDELGDCGVEDEESASSGKDSSSRTPSTTQQNSPSHSRVALASRGARQRGRGRASKYCGSQGSSGSRSSAKCSNYAKWQALAKKILAPVIFYLTFVAKWLWDLVKEILEMSAALIYDVFLKAYLFVRWHVLDSWQSFKDSCGQLLAKIKLRTDKGRKRGLGHGDRHQYLEQNLPLPSTGEEAIKRLLACRGLDYYSVLGVTPDAPQEEIRKYYRRQAFLVHPDKNKTPGAEEAFKVLGHAFEEIGEPAKREVYDKRMLGESKVGEALEKLLKDLERKIEEAANMICCTNCPNKHRRIKIADRPVYAARYCSQCNIRHAAREGDIWAETWMYGLKWQYLACMEGAVYNVSDWAACQAGNLMQLKPDAHIVQYRIVSGKKRPARDQHRPPTDLPTDPEIEDFFNQLCRDKFPAAFGSSSGVPGNSPPQQRFTGGPGSGSSLGTETGFCGGRRRDGRSSRRFGGSSHRR